MRPASVRAAPAAGSRASPVRNVFRLQPAQPRAQIPNAGGLPDGLATVSISSPALAVRSRRHTMPSPPSFQQAL
ncbi:hypothetical protein PtB15_15B103 [Puccinia triticina]|nr:hypothetical protein PtB15_15B103 [Puccinia triticina]